MNKIVKDIFTGPTSRRPHRIVGPVFWLIAWSFFGTTHQVMHTGSFLEMALLLWGTDAAMCLYLYAKELAERRMYRGIPQDRNNADEKKNDMGRAA